MLSLFTAQSQHIIMIYPCIEQAVNYMATGSFSKAMNVLDHAIHGLRAYFHAQGVRMAVEHDAYPTKNAEGAISGVEMILGPDLGAASNKSLTRSEYPIFKRAVLIRGAETIDWSSEVNVAKITAAILFNKGLIFHLLSEGDINTPSQAALNTRA